MAIHSTVATLHQHMQDIRYEDLPKTFQDAVLLAHRLGVQYMWIDALRIVQDDPNDLELGISEMHNVFAHAEFTIAASFGKDSAAGLLQRRPDPPEHASRTGWPPLRDRGWALQEEFFSRRLLYFEHQETSWKCNTEERCECQDPNYSPKKEPSYEEWYILVQNYSRRRLTSWIDWQTGVFSLAQLFARHLNDEIFVGPWKNDLLNGLLWWRLRTGLKNKEYVAPSWSWGSARGQVRYLPTFCKEERYVEVVETFGRSLPSGITREGEIILRGAPMRGITDEDPGAVKKFNFSSNARLAPSLGFWITSQGWEDDEAKRLAQEKRLEVAREGLSAQELEAAKDEFETIQKSHNVILHWDFSEDAQRSREGAFWITCIWVGYHGSYSGHEIAFFGRLLVEPCPSEAKRCTFKRIGMIDVAGSKEGVREWGRLVDQYEKEEVTLV